MSAVSKWRHCRNMRYLFWDCQWNYTRCITEYGTDYSILNWQHSSIRYANRISRNIWMCVCRLLSVEISGILPLIYIYLGIHFQFYTVYHFIRWYRIYRIQIWQSERHLTTTARGLFTFIWGAKIKFWHCPRWCDVFFRGDALLSTCLLMERHDDPRIS